MENSKLESELERLKTANAILNIEVIQLRRDRFELLNWLYEELIDARCPCEESAEGAIRKVIDHIKNNSNKPE